MAQDYKKVESISQLQELFGQGYKLWQSDKDPSKWFAIKGSDKYYIPATIRQEAPEIFAPESIEKEEGASDVPATPGKPKLTVEQAGGAGIEPSEFILHDTPRRILETVWFMEGLQNIEKAKRHELAFARIDIDPKGNPVVIDKFTDKSGEMLVSLADLAVYRLADCYTKWKGIEPKFELLQEEIQQLELEKAILKHRLQTLEREQGLIKQAAILVTLKKVS